jgi:hypothetical protein
MTRSTVLQALIVLCLSSAMLSGCAMFSENPRKVVLNLYRGVETGDSDAVWSRMSKADRAKFMQAVGVATESEARKTLIESWTSDFLTDTIEIVSVEKKRPRATV